MTNKLGWSPKGCYIEYVQRGTTARTWWRRARSPKAAGGCPEPLPEGGHRGAPAVPMQPGGEDSGWMRVPLHSPSINAGSGTG